MANRFRDQLRSGREAIQAARDSAGGGGKFTPVHFFESGETKYVQFLDPIEDWPEVLMHQWIIVDTREDGSPVYERFISRKDPNLDGPEGYDPIIDRFKESPTRRCVALAVEVTPKFRTEGKRKVVDGFSVAERQFENKEGETITVPNVALVIESPHTLFGQLEAVADHVGAFEETIVGIKVTGEGMKKDFSILPTNEAALNLDEELSEFFAEFDLDEYLESLSDEERMHELIDPLPDDWNISKFGKKGKKGKSEEKKGGSTHTRKQTDDEPEEEATSTHRTRRFADLKDKAQAAQED